MELFKKSPLQTRWSSFENLTAGKGTGAQRNKGAKGHAFGNVKAGETVTLLDVPGPGTLRRIWMTLGPSDPQMVRSLRLDMFWDGATKPAVSVPLSDFFGWVHGHRPPAFENELIASPESKSFVCFIPMPFRTGGQGDDYE